MKGYDILSSFGNYTELTLSFIKNDALLIKIINDPLILLVASFTISLISGITFAILIERKIKNWESKKIPPLPLGSFYTRASWFLFFIGITFIFTAALRIFNFPPLSSLIFSIINSLFFGIIMWKAINDVLVQLENGSLKEIDDFI